MTLSPKAARHPQTAALWRRLSFAGLLLSCFLYFNWDSVRVRFIEDDMMNMANYWTAGPWRLVYSPFLIWRGYYRPLGGLFYLPLFKLYGLNPAPYHVAYLLLLLVNVYLVYRFARVLGCAELEAGLAALMLCYQVRMAILYYAISNVYDVLCCLFYLAAFVYYAEIRRRGRTLVSRESAAFLFLYLCALNSKEMAVTLPLVLIAYEWIYYGPPRWGQYSAWLRSAGRIAFFTAILTPVYVYGRALGPEGIVTYSGYQPLLSMHRVWEFQMRALTTLVPVHHFERASVVLFWAALFYLAYRRPNPILRFCCVFLILTPLPVELLQGRGEATLYLPMAGWAIFVSIIFVDLAGATARFLSAEPIVGQLGRSTLFAVVIAAGVSAWAYANHHIKQAEINIQMVKVGTLTGEVIQQFQTLHPRVNPGSKVVFLNDPFEEFDMAFIAQLWFRDRSLEIRLNRKTPLSPEQLAQADHLFTYADSKLVQIR